MSKEVFIPQAFAQPAFTPQQTVDFSYFGKYSPSIENRPQNLKSIYSFCNEVSDKPLTDFMSEYLKEGKSMPNYEFVLDGLTQDGYRRLNPPGSGEFFLDAWNGIVLGVRNKRGKKLYFGALGIRMGEEINSYGTKLQDSKEGVRPEGGPARETMDFANKLPVIVQIQGPNPSSFNSYDHTMKDIVERNSERRYNVVLPIIAAFKWERALINIAEEYAAESGMPAIYLLPAEKNKWKDKASCKTDLKLRYDITAERMGYTMQSNGLYGISLLGYKSRLKKSD